MIKTTQQIFTPFEIVKGQIPRKIQILPAGNVIKGKDGRTWTIKNVHELARVSNEYLPIHCIDENHAVDLQAGQGGTTPAFGWFNNITVENNGELWADVEWTERGYQALKNKDYRFLSPVFSNDENGNITVILRAALTNSPNLDLVALNSEQLKSVENETPQNIIKKIIQALNLPENSSGVDIIKSIKKLKQSPSALNSSYISELTQKTIELENRINNLVSSASVQEGELIVNEAVRSGIITPANKDFYISLCATDNGLEKVKSIIRNSAPVVLPVQRTPYFQSENIDEDSEFISSIGYTQERWREIKKMAGKK